MHWSAHDIASIVARALRDADAALNAEQAVRGLDARDEVGLHPLIAGALSGEGLGVLREQPYPGSSGDPLRRDRERCDLVTTPAPGLALLDPVSERRLRRAAAGTLFERQAEVPPSDAVPCDEALWIEVKTVGQHAFIDGVPGPNPSYAAGMTACLADLAKLARDPVILHAASLTVAFAADEATLRHDLRIVVDRAMSRTLPIGMPAIECIPITERIGNAACAVQVIPLSKATVVADA